MRLINHHTIGEHDTLAETTGEHLAEQALVVLFQVLVNILTWNLYQQRPVLLGERLEDDGGKPCFILLLCDVALD